MDIGEIETIAHYKADYFCPGVDFILDIGAGYEMSKNQGWSQKVYI